VISVSALVTGELQAPQFYERRATVDVECCDMRAPTRPLFILQIPLSISFVDLKPSLARAARLDFDPRKDSIQLEFGQMVDGTEHRIPIVARYHPTASTIFAARPPAAWARHRLWFALLPGLSEDVARSLLSLSVVVSLDAKQISFETHIFVPRNGTCAALLAAVCAGFRPCSLPLRPYLALI
jgi:hypothetical protein